MSPAPLAPRVPAHQLTTRHLGAAYPLLAGSGSLARGTLIGRNLLGGAFTYDPFERYATKSLSNPNMVVLGQIGRGKSALVKTYLWRQAVFGRRAWVVDPKGEYRGLARRWGVRPIALRPGGPVRLNPLERATPAQLGGAPGANQASSELLATLAATGLGRRLAPRERTALELALAATVASSAPATVPGVVERLFDPLPGTAAAVRSDDTTLVEDGRDVALELRRLVHGDLAGMFDGPTSKGVDLSGPLVVLDLSALYGSPALAMLMACATAWLQAAATRETENAEEKILLVVDEAWVILHQLSVARWLQASFKLSRARGVANMVVLHRVSDLKAAGAEGSEQVRLAEGLLADSETRVVYAQPTGEVEAAAGLLSLTDTECQLLPHLRRGVALWKLGPRSFLVEHLVGPAERDLVDTDAAMATGPPRR